MQRCVTWKYRQAHLDADLDPQSQAAASGAKLVFRPRLRIPRSVLDSVGKHGVVCHSLSTHTHTQFLFADNTQGSIWIPDFSPELVCISTCTSHTPNKLRDGTRPFLHLSLLLQVRVYLLQVPGARQVCLSAHVPTLTAHPSPSAPSPPSPRRFKPRPPPVESTATVP